MEHMRTLLRDNELFRTYVTVSYHRSQAPRRPQLRPQVIDAGLPHVPGLLNAFLSCLNLVGGGAQAVQPPEASRHGGQASPATHQIPTAAQKHSQEDGRAVGP